MTPKHPIYEAVDGRRYAVVGHRGVVAGDTFIAAHHCEPRTAKWGDYILGVARTILKELPSPEPVGGERPMNTGENSAPSHSQAISGVEIKRRGEYEQPCGESSVFDPDVDDLIDAACAAVNNPRDFSFVCSVDLAAALDPFTEPVAPEERFYFERHAHEYRVCDRQDFEWRVLVPTHQDAEAIAAMKNGADNE